MEYKPKYLNKSRAIKRERRQTPEMWVSGPDPIVHDKYYAWLKHRAQARYRGEPYELTWEDWQAIWPTELFLQRGRSAEQLCLVQIDPDLGWIPSNVQVITRREYVRTLKKGSPRATRNV
jgi:hypothetical protein